MGQRVRRVDADQGLTRRSTPRSQTAVNSHTRGARYAGDRQHPRPLVLLTHGPGIVLPGACPTACDPVSCQTGLSAGNQQGGRGHWIGGIDTVSKKPADQTSTNGANGAGDAVDLEVDLDNDAAGSASGDEDDDDDEDESGSTGGSSIADQISAGIAAALPQISAQFQSEMDRRINSALNKGRKPAPKDDEDNGQQSAPAAIQKADVRGARLAFREILPDSIKLLGDEERALANDFGQNLIRARALQGFDDEEQVGREVAVATAEFLKKARSFYSSRTKRVLERSGALVPQGGGQSPTGDTKPSSVAASFEAAEKKDRELFPERYAQQ